MNEKPIGEALIICDQIITEAGTNKKSLIGTFNSIGSLHFPMQHPRLCTPPPFDTAMILQENPALVIGSDQRDEIAQEIGSECYYFTMSWTLIPTKHVEIPPSFEAGLGDVEEGRVVDLDVALT